MNGVGGTTAVTAGTWNHLVLTGTLGKNASTYTIGAVTGGVYLVGLIADVRLYSQTLSKEEVKSLYDLTRWRFD